MVMHSDGSALAMALPTVPSVHVSISSQSSVCAACALTGGEVPKRFACQSSDVGVEVISTRQWYTVELQAPLRSTLLVNCS
eukprot:5110974-Pleurochrysis_carterae.AAC.1